jgi:broad specificity phosphatase PhoE
LGTLSRDIRQLDENPFGQEDHKEINILIVSHGLTCRLLLMRFFQLTVEEFENSYNSQNAKLVVMDRCLDPESGREYYRLDEQAKEALNLKGDVSNQRPVYWRSRYKENSPVDRGLRLFEEDEDDIDMDR